MTDMAPDAATILALLRKWRVPLLLALTRRTVADGLTAVMGNWE